MISCLGHKITVLKRTSGLQLLTGRQKLAYFYKKKKKWALNRCCPVTFKHRLYQIFPIFLIGFLAYFPAQAEAGEPYKWHLRLKSRSVHCFLKKKLRKKKKILIILPNNIWHKEFTLKIGRWFFYELSAVEFTKISSFFRVGWFLSRFLSKDLAF